MKGDNGFENLLRGLFCGEECLSVIGLGYVGMPLAVEFAKHLHVIGFDINEERICQYKSGIDPTKEVGDAAIRNTTVDFSTDANSTFPSLPVYSIIRTSQGKAHKTCTLLLL